MSAEAVEVCINNGEYKEQTLSHVSTGTLYTGSMKQAVGNNQTQSD